MTPPLTTAWATRGGRPGRCQVRRACYMNSETRAPSRESWPGTLLRWLRRCSRLPQGSTHRVFIVPENVYLGVILVTGGWTQLGCPLEEQAGNIWRDLVPWGTPRGGVAVWSFPAGTRTHTNVCTLCAHPLVNLFPVHGSPEIHNGSAAASLCRITPH